MALKKYISEDKIFIFFNYILAGLFLLVTLYPIWFVVIASFSDIQAVIGGKVRLLPKDVTLAGYKMMLGKTEIWTGYLNTILYTFVGTCINIVFTIPAGYALSRKTLPFRRSINFFFLLTMFISGGLIPTYMVIMKLKLVDTFAIMVLMGAVNVWNMIICRTFFQNSIPIELIEAAKIDGANEFKVFLKVIIPLSKAIVAVMVLYFAVAHWNNYSTALIYLRDKSKYPLQMVLRNLLTQSQLDTAGSEGVSQAMMDIQSMKYGVIIVACVPVLILYPFVQKYFVKGVMVGAVKG